MFKTILSSVGLALIVILVVLGFNSFFTRQTLLQESVLGSTEFLSSGRYRLSGSGVGSSDTTITLQSFQVPVTDDNVSMSMFGSDIGFLTLEPGNEDRREFVSFTGITQNSDGTAQLTGIIRGLLPFSPYTASTSYQLAHPGGSVAIVSNPPQLYDRALFINNDATISAQYWFTGVSSSTPRYVTNPTWASVASTSFASKDYVDTVATSGSPDADLDTKGLVEQATNTEAALMAAEGSGDTTAPLVITTALVSSTSTQRYQIPISRLDGDIDINFLPLTSSDTWHFGGNATFSANFTATSTATFGQGSSATATLVFLNGNNNNAVTLTIGTTSASYTITLPRTLPTRGQFLKFVDSSGQLIGATPTPDIIEQMWNNTGGSDEDATVGVTGLFSNYPSGSNVTKHTQWFFVSDNASISTTTVKCMITGNPSGTNFDGTFRFDAISLSGATSTDSSGGGTIFATAVWPQFVDIPITSASYNTLPQNAWWSFAFTRNGATDGGASMYCSVFQMRFNQ